jgi:hypothetical protein
VIVVIGSVAYRPDPAGGGQAVGLAPSIAIEAAAAGAPVEMLARIGEDGVGEDVLLALARARVGHLAVLRDPARPTALAPVAPDAAVDDEDDDLVPALLAEAEAAAERPTNGRRPALLAPVAPTLEPADLSLGLQYLRDFHVVVAVEPIADGGAAVIAEVAAFADAELVVVASPGVAVPEAYAAATLIEAPVEDADGAFARLVGRYAAGLDGGAAPGDAFRAATAEGGWQVAAD